MPKLETKDRIYIWLVGLQTLLIGVGVIIALCQLNKMAVQMRADFTYKVFQDHEKWLDGRKEFKKWIYFNRKVLLKPNYEKWELDDFLGYYEALATLEDKDLIDKDVAYALFSYDLMTTYEAHNFELRKIIEEIRKEENDPDIFSGVEDLYKEMKRLNTEGKKVNNWDAYTY
jgi:hypothetical protein